MNSYYDSKVGYGKYLDKTFYWVISRDPKYFEQIPALFFSKYGAPKKSLYKKAKNRFLLAKLNNVEQDYSSDVVALIKKQTPYIEIKEFLFGKKLSKEGVFKAIREAKEIIKTEYENERNYLVDVHALRYEEIFKDNINPDVSRVPLPYRKQFLADHFAIAMDTLSAKERVLGVHSKSFKIQLNNFYQTRKNKEKTSLDFSQLETSELKRLLELIDKLRKPDNIIMLTDQQEESEEEVRVENIPHEEIIEAPMRDSKQTDIVKDQSENEQITGGKTLHDLKHSLNQSLEKKILDLYKNKK